jgi:2'-hydroxyisoflavone reductase
VHILVLGGTLFLGRAFVAAALAAGHELTLFTRGRKNPHLFPEAEKVHGDRTQDLSALDGRSWDAVADVSTFLPRAAALSADALRGRVGRYLYISSISAYADLSVPPVEGAPTATADPASESMDDYGGLKALCEQVVTERYGGRALVVRPGLIVGPHDPTGRFTYWPHRVARAGDVLVPGTPDDLKQFVDVRDLGEWLVRLLEHDADGLFNATGLPLRFGELLDTCRAVTESDARFVYVPAETLVAKDVGEWMELPLWLADPAYAAMQQADVSRAVAAGLTFRPLAETVRATLAEAEPQEGVGLSPQRERELLELHG